MIDAWLEPDDDEDDEETTTPQDDYDDYGTDAIDLDDNLGRALFAIEWSFPSNRFLYG